MQPRNDSAVLENRESTILGTDRRTALHRSLLVLLLTATAVPSYALGGPKPKLMTDIRVQPTTFLPILNQKTEVSLRLRGAGRITIDVVDRDGVVVRNLAAGKPVRAGRLKLGWDGKDRAGRVVPDESYSFLIELDTGTTKERYFPASAPAEAFVVPPLSYSRRDGTIVFELPKAARVNLQAGQAARDEKSGKITGPVLITILNREPKPAGRVVATWNGLDDSGAMPVSSLPHFAIGISCTPLPENSVIATGNRDRAFLDYVKERTGESKLTFTPQPDRHYTGLRSVEDFNPRVDVSVIDAPRAATSGCWHVSGTSLSLAVALSGPTAAHVKAHPARLLVFLGIQKLLDRDVPKDTSAIEVTLREAIAERTYLSVNWSSSFGPTAVGIVCLEPPTPVRHAEKGVHP